MKKAIVSGANGFIGRSIVKELRAQGVEVVAFVYPISSGDFTDEVESCFFDFNDPLAVLNEDINLSGCDAYFNFAWQSVVGEKQADSKTQLANVTGCIEQIKLCKEIACPVFINAGSISENAPQYVDYSADPMPPPGQLIYGSAKLAAKLLGLSVSKSLGISFIQGTITNTYGPGEKSERFVISTLRKIISGDPLRFTAATQLYDFIYIEDLARAFFHIAEYGAAYTSYAIGSGEAKALKLFIDDILDVCKDHVRMKPEFGAVSFSGLDYPMSCYDTEPLNKDTGFKPGISFKDGVAKTLEWLIQTEKQYYER